MSPSPWKAGLPPDRAQGPFLGKTRIGTTVLLHWAKVRSGVEAWLATGWDPLAGLPELRLLVEDNADFVVAWAEVPA